MDQCVLVYVCCSTHACLSTPTDGKGWLETLCSVRPNIDFDVVMCQSLLGTWVVKLICHSPACFVRTVLANWDGQYEAVLRVYPPSQAHIKKCKFWTIRLH